MGVSAGQHNDVWTAERLHQTVKDSLHGRRLVVVSHREPYLHEYEQANIVCRRPASGLVSALEPVLQACGGLWVAHGGGSADRIVVDEHDCVPVPPEAPRYTLKRVWLSKQEENGYYYGFSNGGLWPLCHVVFVRPRFDLADWESYVQVNRKFAEAILAEIADTPALVWIQDYHFALLPQLIKEARPDVVVAQFWHIPWPNLEAFRLCPWRQEMLWGLLAADLLGFHIRYHCDNFLATVERELEVRVDRERSSVFHHGGVETLVHPFPISTDFTGLAEHTDSDEVKMEAQRLQARREIRGRRVCLGLDRLDYTKGIPERLRAFDRFLEKYPQWQRQVVFVQVGPESRTAIPRYRVLNEEIAHLASEINRKYGNVDWVPVLLLRQNVSLSRVLAWYRLTDVCVVSSLHDGMNLVAKEFVAAQNEARGVLVLSRFTGAARELDHALLINPYDTETFADTLATALEMSGEEREGRMQRLRETVKYNNIYRWAGTIISSLAALQENSRWHQPVSIVPVGATFGASEG